MRFAFFATLLTCFLAQALPASAATCNEKTRLENGEVKRLIDVIKNPEADAFEQIIAVETLSCETRKPVRDLAFRAMLRSPNDIIRTDAVFRALADRSSIVVQLSSRDDLDKKTLDFVKKYPEVIFDVKFVDVEKRCISIYSNTACDPKYAAIVTRNEIVLRNNDVVIILESRADGMLMGKYTYRENRGIPAKIDIY